MRLPVAALLWSNSMTKRPHHHWKSYCRGHTLALVCTTLLLVGCMSKAVLEDPVAKHPDTRIIVAPSTPNGKHYKAYAPECPAWTAHKPDPNDNMPQPQIGCANQRNLALMIDQPTDLVGQRKLGKADATRSAAALQRYHENKISGLYDPAQPPAAKE
jgi:hypothetical protein